MKSRTKKVVSVAGPEKVAYILPQGNLRPARTRKSGRPVTQKTYDASGYLLVGMYGSLSKTFTSHDAAAKYASKNGFTVKPNRIVPPAEARAREAAALLLLDER